MNQRDKVYKCAQLDNQSALMTYIWCIFTNFGPGPLPFTSLHRGESIYTGRQLMEERWVQMGRDSDSLSNGFQAMETCRMTKTRIWARLGLLNWLPGCLFWTWHALSDSKHWSPKDKAIASDCGSIVHQWGPKMRQTTWKLHENRMKPHHFFVPQSGRRGGRGWGISLFDTPKRPCLEEEPAGAMDRANENADIDFTRCYKACYIAETMSHIASQQNDWSYHIVIHIVRHSTYCW